MAWTDDELRRIGDATKLEISSLRADGALSRYTTIWVVRAGDELYVRSAYGPGSAWYRRAKAAGAGRIRAGGVERDVTFAEAGPQAHAGIDSAYGTKYERFGPGEINLITGAEVAPLTIRLVPRP